MDRKCRYRVSYFDPSDPRGERWRTWRFKTLKGAQRKRADLMTAWKAKAKEIPIRRCKKRKF